MVFHHKQKQCNPDSIPILEINRTQIKLAKEFNFSGITINEYLYWNSHTIKIANKLSRAIGIMHKVRKIIPKQILKLMYSSMILPHLYLAITAWGYTCRRVYGLQNKAIRTTVEPLTNDHPHQRPSLSYDHISCDGQWLLFVYESLTSDHPSYTTTPM